MREGKLNISRLPYKAFRDRTVWKGREVPTAGFSEEMSKAAFSLSKEGRHIRNPFCHQQHNLHNEA